MVVTKNLVRDDHLQSVGERAFTKACIAFEALNANASTLELK
jgi:hypothetical protein